MKTFLALLIIIGSGLMPYEGKILRVIDGDTLEQYQVSRTKNQDTGVKPIFGKILRIIDGDTFVLQSEEGNLKIRMDGIDAPEMDQEFGMEAKKFLIRYLYKDVRILPNGVDRYGRTIGTLYDDGTNINLLEVGEGYAWHYKKYSNDQELARAEELARMEKKGLWKNENALSPWEWRKKQLLSL